MSVKQTTVFLSIIFVSALLFSACQNTTPAETSLESTSELVPGENDGQQEMTKVVSSQREYESPAGSEKVGFILTVDDQGVISQAETEVLATAPISVMRQESFAKELPTVLVGKKLTELDSIDRVGGSSLTTTSFNEALVDLKAQL